jgi:hypothetical protein
MDNVARLVQVIVGFVVLVTGAFLMFSQKLTPDKENARDLFAISGLVLMIIGIVLLFSPLLR